MTALRPGEWDHLAAAFSGATTVGGSDGASLITLPDVSLPSGWSAAASTVWFMVPVGYPAAQPDCFWADADLRLTNGALPSNSAPQAVPVIQCAALWFSWHLTAWRPSQDSVTTYARFIQQRFDDAR